MDCSNTRGFLYLRAGTSRADAAPGRGGKLGHLLEQRGRASTQGHEGDAHLIQTRQMGVGGQARIEHQVRAAARRGVFFQNSMKRKISSASSPLRRSALE